MNNRICFYLSAVLITFSLGFHACKKKDPKPEIKPALSVSPTELSFTAAGEAKPLSVTANKAWTLTGTPEWVTASATSGNGNTTVTITASANTVAKRDAKLTFTVAGATPVEVTLNQAATITTVPDIVLTITAGTYTYNGEEIKPIATVTADGAILTAGTDYDLSYNANTNAGEATVTATGKGTYAGKSDTKPFTIAKCPITITADDANKIFWDDDPELYTTV